jgi:septal ring factor EnvC (AmiA/AmiB activator)
MSILNLFTQQRNHWRSQATDKSSDYVAGGLAALNQAEVAFKATTLYNVQQQATATQQELEEVSYELTQTRRRIAKFEADLATAIQQEAELPEEHQNRARCARKTLRKVVNVANYLSASPENRLRKILELVNEFITTYQLEVKMPKSDKQTGNSVAD